MTQHKPKKTPRPPAAAHSKHRAHQTWDQWLPALALVMMVACCYLPALGGGYVMDDNFYVTEQPVNLSLDGLRRIWFEPLSVPQYYPLLHTSFWLQYQLWQLNPAGYHIVNVVLQACIVVLAWRILLRLQVPGAWLAAAIFAVHPVCVESVAWVTKLMNLQSMLLALASLGCYLQFEPPTVVENDQRRRTSRWRYYGLSLALFLLALLSKTVVASLPAVLLVVYWWKRGKIGWRDVWPLVPFLILGIAFGLMTAWLEQHHAGAHGADWAMSFVQRCLLAGRAVWFYAGKLVWPYPLLFYYPRWTIDPGLWWQWLYPLGVLVVVATLWGLRNRIGRGPLAAVLIYVGILFPALGFFNIYGFRFSYVFDHYQYHAMLALIALAAAAWNLWYQWARGALQSAAFAIAASAISLLMLLAFYQSRLYANAVTMYETTLQRNPESWVAHNLLGAEFANAGRSNEAIQHFEQALRLKADYHEAHGNLGIALAHQGQLPEAIQHYESSLRLKSNNPKVHNNLGAALVRSDQLPEAIAHFEESLRLAPDYPDAHNNLANALLQAGRSQEAVEHYLQALQLKSDFLEPRNSLAKILQQSGRFQDALQQYRLAVQSKPNSAEAHFNFASALLQLGNVTDAIEHFQTAVRLKPDYTEAYNNLGVALFNSGQTQEAIEQFQLVIRLKPQFAEAYNNLGNALTGAKRLKEAIESFQQALNLKPDFEQAHNNLGNALVDAGRVPEAITQFERALQLKPNSLQAYLNLAAAYAQIRRFDDAATAAQRALDLAHSSEQTAQARQIEERLKYYRSLQTVGQGATPQSNKPPQPTKSP